MNAMMLPERNYKSLLLAALLIGAASTAFAWTSLGEGTNLEYEIDGTVLRLQSPDPGSNATIPGEAFKENFTITSVSLPSNVTTIEGQAFMGCTALATVDLSNVQTISTSAFQGCTGLTEIVIPPSVTNIGVSAFYGCSALKDVLCRPQTPPALLGTDGFTGCHSELKICVAALGAYGHATNWSNYYDQLDPAASQLILCFLDEYDEQDVTTGKITQFRSTRTSIDIFRTLRKAGCFNTLTLPFNVPDIEASPLTGAEVYEFVGATVVDNALQLDIMPLAGSSLIAGTPYLIQWPNTGEVLNRMHFDGISWDDDQTAAATGTGQVKYHGFYGRTHIDDDTNGEQHLNLFLGGNNTLYWPTDGDDQLAKMLGFRAWFEVSTGASFAPVHRGMPASLRIKTTPTDVNSVTGNPSPVTEKVLRSGQLIIIRNGEQYSITGQKL